MTPVLPLADRTMVSRRGLYGGQCKLCLLAMSGGQLIARSAGTWYHARCLIEARRAAETETVTRG